MGHPSLTRLLSGLLLLQLCVTVTPAQQPNSPTATLVVNGLLGGPPYPIPAGGLQGTTVALNISGGPPAAGLPFILAHGPVVPGFAMTPHGLSDLDFTSPRFAFLLNGFDPLSPTAPLAQLGPASQSTLSFFYPHTSAVPAGAQVAVADPTHPLFIRLAAAVDFAPPTPEALVVNIGSTGVAIWQNNGGAVSLPGSCQPALFLNDEIVIGFGGPVDPMSIPGPGPAVGSIEIRDSQGVPADGVFVVRDDPRLAPGNQRVVAFRASLPSGPSLTCGAAGFQPSETYTLSVPSAGPSVVMVNGQPNARALFTCFDTPTCDPQNVVATLTDPTPGAPFVISTTPALANPAPAPIDPVTIANNTISLSVSEFLIPESVTIDNVRLINEAIGAQVPGTVAFTQATPTTPGQIDYVAAVQLPNNATFRLELDPTVTDVGGNPLELVQGMPGAVLFLQTTSAPVVPQTPIVESFTNASGQGALVGPVTWGGGGGGAAATFSNEVTGSGAFGALSFGPGPGTLDTGAAPGPGFAEGVWDTSSATISAGATVRVIGPYRAHVRSLGSISISGGVNASAGTSPVAPTGSPEQGPGAGAFNNGGSPAASTVRGGVGGPGAGGGGRASQDGFTLRTSQSESGFGPTISGQPNPGPFGANDSFGGGPGGQGGFRFPAGGVMGELGGLGGAGGSSFTTGEDGQPRTTPLAGCSPYAPTVQTISLATPIPAIFI
ncbi:MAG: hypothetical protein CMJ83_05495, partial [Planctomycetes bacterium]|nr:hypothetical protein [Planctomycetota bacterium]